MIFLQFFAQPLVLTATDAFQVDAIRARGGSFVEKNWDAIAFPDFMTDAASKGNAILQGNARDWDEGDDVGGADAGVRAGMHVHVDQFEGLAGTENGRFANRFGVACEGDDAAIVIGVHFPVEDVDIGDAAHGLDNRIDLGGVAAFREIRYAFDQSFHWLGSLIPNVDYFAALDGHPAAIHPKIIRNFAVILHFEDGQVGLLAGFEGADVLF